MLADKPLDKRRCGEASKALRQLLLGVEEKAGQDEHFALGLVGRHPGQHCQLRCGESKFQAFYNEDQNNDYEVYSLLFSLGIIVSGCIAK